MKLKETELYQKVDEGEFFPGAWKARNSEVLAYFIGEIEAFFITRGSRGGIYTIIARRTFQWDIREKNPKFPFGDWTITFSTNTLEDVAKYIRKAKKLGLNTYYPKKTATIIRHTKMEKEL